MPDITEYPEHEKLISVNGNMQMLDGFLTWLSEVKAVELCVPVLHDHLELVQSSDYDMLIAGFFGVAWDKYLAEQEALLEETGPAPDWQP